MKPFHTIAIPHKDILEGRLTMDVFAADLWEAYHNRGPAEYKDATLFFQKTYMTQGLNNLLKIIEKRINGKGGDPTIQIQTPFGGGKTHSLIAIMHKAKEWNAKVAVIVGTNLSAEETLWGTIEKQLTGNNTVLTGLTSPGKEKLKQVLLPHQPLIILMDEVLEYITKAAGKKIEKSTLAEQTMAFLQELTEVVSILEKVSLIVTLPSSIIEHYSHEAERFYSQLQKIVGRIEKIYTPVDESEIAKVIRQRLFASVDKAHASLLIQSFMEYAQKEGILPAGIEPTEYRDRFLDAYPFMPEVIDILYHRWGSFPNFQRTRGVLRLLSLVVASLKSSTIPYISLADFDLANSEIRQELLKHLGTEYNSVIAQDITDADAGSKKIDHSLGDAYKGLHLAVRAATTIFMYSFSGGSEKGATLAEIKRLSTSISCPSSVVSEAVEQLKGKLFYFQFQNDRYFFSNQPNINRIILTKIENIKESDIIDTEKWLIQQSIEGEKFKTYIWQKDHSSIPDTDELKLIILREEKKEVILSILTSKGATRRVNCNTIFFLAPFETERMGFVNIIKRYRAYQAIEDDTTLSLKEEQRKEIRSERKKIESELKDAVRRLYRIIIIPQQVEYKKEDLGIPTYGERKSLDSEVYERLRSSNEILEKLAPIVIKERYLSNKTHVSTQQILNSFSRTPGEPRLINKSIFESSIIEGVEKGIFGLGEIEENQPKCVYFKEKPSISFDNNEIIISEALCKEQRKKEPSNTASHSTYPTSEIDESTKPSGISDVSQSENTSIVQNYKENINLEFIMPKGKGNDIMKIINHLHVFFESINLKIYAHTGQIPNQDYEKIQESLRQLGINLK